jgi:hypothetical protein
VIDGAGALPRIQVKMQEFVAKGTRKSRPGQESVGRRLEQV